LSHQHRSRTLFAVSLLAAMGCGASAEPDIVEPEEEEEDPLKACHKRIKEERKKIKDLDSEEVILEQDLRYFETALKKAGEVQDKMEDELEDAKAFFNDLKLHISNQDALDLREASEGWGTDETKMAKVIVCRLPETIELTDQIYRRNYGRSLEDQIRGENHTLMGMLTGSMTNFGKFLCYRAMPTAQRDSVLIHKCMAGFGCSDFILMEILSTRTNQELKDAAAAYEAEHGESMVERIKSETGGFGKKWYGLWCDTLVEFDRDEREGVQCDPAEVAQALYDAGEGKWMGCDEQPFIDHLCKANDETVAAIVQAYEELGDSKKSLFQAAEDKMGGDLEFAVLARLRPKPKFFAYRLFKACKGWGTDEECVGRVISCMTKVECDICEETYNELYKGEEAPLNNLRALLASELSGSFLEAINLMMDTTSPKGHRVEMKYYEPNAEQSACYFVDEVKGKYNESEARTLATSDFDGCFQLCGLLDPNDLFICRDYVMDMEPGRDKWEPPERDAELMESELPGELEQAEELLSKLEDLNASIGEGIEAKNGEKATLTEKLHEECHPFKATDHLLDQYRKDNENMLEFCASRDADLVNEAVVGWGTDEAKLIRVLCALPKKQLRRVNEIYQERHGKTLRDVTDDELGGFFEGDFKYFMKCALTKDVELDAELLVESMKGWGTNDTLLCEIICTRSNAELKAAKEIFMQTEGKSLEKWVDGDTSGSYQDFLMACLQANRDESRMVNGQAAGHQAEMVHNCIEGSADYSTLKSFLPRVNVRQVEEIKKKYKEKFGADMMEDIKEKVSIFSGDWQKILTARCFDKPSYYAHTLMGAMKGWGTDENALSRIIGRSSKGDLRRIEQRFQEMFGQSLISAIESEVSGNYKKALVTYLSTEAPGAPEAAPEEAAE